MAILNEHEAPGASERGIEPAYEATPEEEQLVQKCEGLFQRAKKGRAKYDYNWGEYYKLFRGKQWKEQRPSYRASEVLNLVWETVQTQVPVMMDARPKFEYLPKEPGDRQFADLMNDIAASDWERNNWSYTLTEVVYDSHILGTGLSELKFDPKYNKLCYRSLDPFYFFPDPSAESLTYRCGYTVTAEPMDVGKIKRLFPDKAEYIKADVVDFNSQKRIEVASMRTHTPTSDQLYVDIVGSGDLGNTNEVLVKTVYAEDDEIVETAQQGENDAEPVTVKQLKFPAGRKTVYANNVVLSDGAVEYDDDTPYPYQRLINYISSRSFWGISEIEPLESPQRAFNKMVSFALDVLYLAGNPIWVVDSASGVETRNLTNQPGLVIEKNPGTEVRREEGVQLQPFVLQLIDRWKDWFERGSGNQDVSRGIAPGSITAASAIADLQNAAQTRIRLKTKNLDAYLQDFGQQYASRVMQFYTAPQVFRLTGKDGVEKYFRMYMQKNDDGTVTAYVNRFTDDGKMHPDTDEYQLRGKLDVRVTTGSSLPFSKSEHEQRTYSLYDRGIIDGEEVLKSLEYPNWEAIQQRMIEKAQMQAQQQAAGAPQPPAA